MDTNVQVDTPARKNTTKYTFCSYDLSKIRIRGALVKGPVETLFKDTYGNILPLLMVDYERHAMNSLLQFYDSKLRCFTFQDYQLAPTLEEYSCMLGIKISSEIPFVRVPDKPDHEVIARALGLSFAEVKAVWRDKEDISGIPLGFLLSKADGFSEKGDWKSFCTVLAAIIYGTVIFPSLEKFASFATVSVFMNCNPVPTILADTYYAIHARYGSTGAVFCCIPLLYRWFIIHMPKKGPFVDMNPLPYWSRRIMTLTSFDIVWNAIPVGPEFIVNCGEFCYVPLMGTKGCINIHPTLVRRQLGFPMTIDPHPDMEKVGVFLPNGENLHWLEQFAASWVKVHRRGASYYGPKAGYALESYVRWIKHRANHVILLPYKREDPWYPQPEEGDYLVDDGSSSFIPSDDAMSGFVCKEIHKELLAKNTKLESDMRDLSMALGFANQEKKRLAIELEQKNQVLQECGLLEESKRFRGISSSAHNQLTLELEKAKKKIEELHDYNKQLRNEHKRQIRILDNQLKDRGANIQQLLEREKQLEAEIRRHQECEFHLSEEVEHFEAEIRLSIEQDEMQRGKIRAQDILLSKLHYELQDLKRQLAFFSV